jgi:hypothetical protein
MDGWNDADVSNVPLDVVIPDHAAPRLHLFRPIGQRANSLDSRESPPSARPGRSKPLRPAPRSRARVPGRRAGLPVGRWVHVLAVIVHVQRGCGDNAIGLGVQRVVGGGAPSPASPGYRLPAVASAKPPEVRPGPASRKIGCDQAGRQEHFACTPMRLQPWSANTLIRLSPDAATRGDHTGRPVLPTAPRSYAARLPCRLRKSRSISSGSPRMVK